MAGDPVSSTTLKQVLVPAGAAAVVVLLIGVLIATSDWAGPKPGGQGKAGQDAPAGTPGATGMTTKDDFNADGMTTTLPDVNAPDWKPLGTTGIKVWDVKIGTGPECPAGATPQMHYTGWTLDGKSFDSSVSKGKPLDYPLGNLIKGWQEGVPGMKPGGIRRLYIPSELAYGSRGQGGIPPNSTLVFELKLLAF